MIHRTFEDSSDLRVFHQMQVIVDLDRVVISIRGLKVRKLGICHRSPAHNTNGFALFDRLACEHPIAADARGSKLNSRVNPGSCKIIFHSTFYFFFHSGS